MSIVQSGPPEWVWERPADPLKWEVRELPPREDEVPVYELRLACGLQILRVHVFNQEELWSLVDAVAAALPRPTA